MKTLLSILFLVFSLSAYSQNVGVNTLSPQQQLDVNGKIVLSDDAAAPTEGAIRYNRLLKQHEGYNGTEWVSLSAKATGVFPANRVPVYGYVTFTAAGIGQSLQFRRMSDDLGLFQQVPAGKFLIITNIGAHSRSFFTTGRMFFVVGPDEVLDQSPNAEKRLQINISRESPYYISAGAGAPLHIVRAGQYYNAFNSINSEDMELKIQGFLVDDLNY